MTALEIMTLGAIRASFTVSSSTYLTRARQYLNDEINELCAEADWLWRFKNSTIAVTTATNTFALASDVMFPGEFWDQTNSGMLTVRGWDYTVKRDPELDDTGTPSVITLLGISVTTGYWQVRVYPKATVAATVGYTYWSFVPPIIDPATASGSDLLDTTQMNLYIPRYLQEALYQGIAGRFFSGKGARDHAQACRVDRDRVIQRGKDVQGRQATSQKLRFSRYTPRSNEAAMLRITAPMVP